MINAAVDTATTSIEIAEMMFMAFLFFFEKRYLFAMNIDTFISYLTNHQFSLHNLKNRQYKNELQEFSSLDFLSCFPIQT